MLTSLPAPPWEIEDRFPHAYVTMVGGKPLIVPAEQYYRAPHKYQRAIPAQVPKEVDANSILHNKFIYDDRIQADDGNTVFYEVCRRVPRTDIEKQIFQAKIKQHLIRDLHDRGIPRIYFDGYIELEWEGQSYYVMCEDLTALALYRYPRDNQRKGDVFQTICLGLADTPMTVPALNKYDGSLIALDVSAGLAAMILSKYVNKTREYIVALNDLTRYITSVDILELGLAKLWNNVYGVASFTGYQIDRVKLQ